MIVLPAPTSDPPEGSHWYYLTDKAKSRKCWFLRTLGAPTQHGATQDASAMPRTAHAGAAERPATVSVAAPTSTRGTVDSVPPLPRPRPQRAFASSASTQEAAWQATQEERGASIPETPASQESEFAPGQALRNLQRRPPCLRCGPIPPR